MLLAQIDSDARTGMGWGDAGRLYWLIRREDLPAGRFERAHLHLAARVRPLALVFLPRAPTPAQEAAAMPIPTASQAGARPQFTATRLILLRRGLAQPLAVGAGEPLGHGGAGEVLGGFQVQRRRRHAQQVVLSHAPQRSGGDPGEVQAGTEWSKTQIARVSNSLSSSRVGW